MFTPCLRRVTTPASRRTARCLEMVDMSSPTRACRSQTHFSPSRRASTISRRLGWPRALKIRACASMNSLLCCMLSLYLIIWQNIPERPSCQDGAGKPCPGQRRRGARRRAIMAAGPDKETAAVRKRPHAAVRHHRAERSLRPAGWKSVTSTGCDAPWPGRIPPYVRSGWQARPAAWHTGSCGSRAGPARAGARAA